MRPEDWLKRHAKDMPATSVAVSLLLKSPILYTRMWVEAQTTCDFFENDG
jgi:hypothetical protein